MSIVDKRALGEYFDWDEDAIEQLVSRGLPVHQRDPAGNAELFDTVKVIEFDVSLAILRHHLDKCHS